jgi:hypothetical protein
MSTEMLRRGAYTIDASSGAGPLLPGLWNPLRIVQSILLENWLPMRHSSGVSPKF